ncbi:histidine phosphatase family protein [Aestuariivita sp.]|jgi:probable phosphoglycerate mutase|uniref:histidine phosphatase family protein n=1 Tax=Aestuariivita sp. TaxID=1872407 RepID=UPI002170A0C1|nr:histidine phosphatase family protein [Aestuariivita sp.]MCE8006735.1 histidine phosphatase family protein [Aestuariivita sp.]
MTHPPIWFLRHGQTEWNAVRRIQGQMESCLSDQGRWHAGEQARVMASLLETEPDCLVSPLARARETAEIALGTYPIQVDPRLMEIHAGDWQGLYYDDVLARWPDLVNDQMTALELFAHAPGGEGMSAFRARVEEVLSGLTRPTVLVAHGLWGQVARAKLRGLSEAEMQRLDNLQGVVYALENGQETVLRAPL